MSAFRRFAYAVALMACGATLVEVGTPLTTPLGAGAYVLAGVLLGGLMDQPDQRSSVQDDHNEDPAAGEGPPPGPSLSQVEVF